MTYPRLYSYHVVEPGLRPRESGSKIHVLNHSFYWNCLDASLRSSNGLAPAKYVSFSSSSPPTNRYYPTSLGSLFTPSSLSLNVWVMEASVKIEVYIPCLQTNLTNC